ncbi:hypothetical protein LINPERPRIM_LOCUS19986 [Linum perenne]
MVISYWTALPCKIGLLVVLPQVLPRLSRLNRWQDLPWRLRRVLHPWTLWFRKLSLGCFQLLSKQLSLLSA